MRCDVCGTENRAERRFCSGCGSALSRACAHCGFINRPDEKFCGGCGAAMQIAPATPSSRQEPVLHSPEPVRHSAEREERPADGERRPITVLFADLAGFTKLSGELDPEVMHGLLGRYFATVDGIVARWGGTIDKHIGDAVMGLFGAPVAHGDDALRAVRAAGEIQAAVPSLASEAGRPLGVHIGIATGEVMASGLGSDQHRAYTVIGPSVNLAARLLGVAGSGETVVDQAVYEQARRHARFEAIDHVRAKGIEGEFRAWKLADVAPEAEPAEPALVGRALEVAQLCALLDSCLARRTGGTACIRGEPGIGKSRLLREVRRIAAERGFVTHTALVLDFGTARGRDPIRAIVSSVLGLPPGADETVKRKAVDQETCGGAFRPFLFDLLDLPQPDGERATYEAMDNAARQRGRAAALHGVLETAAARAPLLVSIEDVHWADPQTLAYVAEMTRAAGALPMVVLLTSRLEGDPLGAAWRAGIQGSPLVTLDLGPLGADDSLALAQNLPSTPSGIAQKCIERAAGNPLFLEQLLHAAHERDERLPMSLHSLVLSRVDHLPERDRLALRAAAVIGQRFELPLLRHLAQWPDYDCAGLVAHFLVRPDGDAFLFAHALIRDGVYASLTHARRAELHRTAAAWYADRDPVLQAEHLDRAGAPEAPAAYLRVARAEMAAFHLEPALSLAERGIALAQAPADIFGLQSLKSEVLRELGEGGPATVAARAALAAAQEPSDRCQAWLAAAAGLRLTADIDAALDALAQAEPLARDGGLDHELAELHYLRGNLHFTKGRIGACRSEHEAAYAHARTLGDPAWEARVLSGLADADYAEGRMRTAHERFTRCVTLCEAHGLTRIAIANRCMIGNCLVYLNDYEGAVGVIETGLHAARQIQSRHAEMFALECLGLTLCSRGHYDEALSPLIRSLELASGLGARRYEAVILFCLADSQRGLHQLEEARANIDRALGLARETGMAFCGPIALGLKAWIGSDAAEAARCRAEAKALLSADAVSHCHFAYHRYGIEAGIEQAAWSRVEQHADALERFTASEPLPHVQFVVARARLLAGLARSPTDASLREELAALQAEFRRLDWRVVWPV